MRKLLLLICVCTACLKLVAQNRTITGKITDENGNPLTGVTVRALSTNQFSVTKADGTFSISVPTTITQLELSSVGYTNQTVNIRGLNTVNISLVSSATSLGEVVV